MKLNKIFWALMVAALPLSFTACSSDDDGVNNDTTPYNFNTPKNQASQGKYLFGVNYSDYKASASLDGTKTITLKYPVKQATVKAFTRGKATPEYEYIVGDYEKKDNVYTIYVGGAKWGTITITHENGKYKITIVTEKPEDSDKNVSNAVADKAKVTIEQSDDTDKLCRTWTPEGIRLLVAKKGQTGGALFEDIKEPSFKAVKEAAEKKGCTIEDDFNDDYLIKAVSFNNTGDLTIKFQNESKSYVAEWGWTGPQGSNPRAIYTKWFKKQNDNGKDNQFIPDGGTVEFKTANYSGECWVEFHAEDIKDNNGQLWEAKLIFRLKDTLN